jgi:uncharacterized hydrophobic protein (TIGR00271 family)
MIKLEVSGRAEAMTDVATLLDGSDGVSLVTVAATTRAGEALVHANVRPEAVDPLLEELRRHGVPADRVAFTRSDVLGRSTAAGGESAGLIWEDVLGIAARSSRPIARYLAFMCVAGVIASYGVLDYNAILVVGAMALSPDLLPITAAGIGLVDRRARLAAGAFLTLLAGMVGAIGAAALCAFIQDRLDLIPSKFDIDATVLGSLTTVNNETIVVALVAGVAGVLALETRASSAVGVAVSVTTIPAAAYLGVALALGERGHAGGAAEVLGANVAMLVVGVCVTLVLQRRLLRHPRTPSRRRLASLGR